MTKLKISIEFFKLKVQPLKNLTHPVCIARLCCCCYPGYAGPNSSRLTEVDALVSKIEADSNHSTFDVQSIKKALQ